MKHFFAFLLFLFSKIAVAQTMPYTLVAPLNYDATKSYRVIFGWHGANLSDTQMRSFMLNLEQLTNNDSFFVYPNSLHNRWDETDLYYFDAILKDVAKSYSIDQKKIISIGYSSGAFFTNIIAARRPNVLAGVVSVAGGNSSSHSLPAMIVHGTRDEWVSYQNGYNSAWNYAQLNQCQEKPSRTAINSCVWLSGCQKPTVWCATNSTHDWPRFYGADYQILNFINSIK
jgi:poly(3-hydroxybutyrate) depolymerase